jgi:FkbM family methyltransferase
VHREFAEETVRRVLGRLGWDSLAGRTVLDIGANIGTETVSFIVRHGAERVIAMEPDPENLRFLRANIALNGVQDQVDVHALALSDRDQTLVFERSADNWGDHRVRVQDPSGPALGGEDARTTIEVQARTLDSLASDGTIDIGAVDLAWIDTQGHEAHVLAGASCLATIPILTEYWPYGLRRAGGLERFSELTRDRTVVDLRGSGPYSPDDFVVDTDLLLLPNA